MNTLQYFLLALCALAVAAAGWWANIALIRTIAEGVICK